MSEKSRPIIFEQGGHWYIKNEDGTLVDLGLTVADTMATANLERQKALDLLQSFRTYSHNVFDENISDYMIQDFIKHKYPQTNDPIS